MNMVGFIQGWREKCCTKNVEIRSNWRSVANEGKESGSWGWSRLYDEGRIVRDVLQVLHTISQN